MAGGSGAWIEKSLRDRYDGPHCPAIAARLPHPPRRPRPAKLRLEPMTDTKNQGFAFPREQFQQIIEDVLAIARKVGASDAAAEVSEGSGLSVSVRKGEVENVERNRDKSVGVAIYIGRRRGNASTSDFSTRALEQTVRA